MNKKKGLFNLFKNKKSSSDTLSETIAPVPASSKESLLDSENKAEAHATVNSNIQNNPVKTASSIPSIWKEWNDPRLVRIDEELLYLESTQFNSKMRSVSNLLRQADAASQEAEPKPRGAKPELQISGDGMVAWIYVIPPANGGPDITENELKLLLAKGRVTHGVLESEIKSIAETPIYNKAVLVAKGTLARDGVDGSVKELYKRDFQVEFQEDQYGSVDYKQLNNIQSIEVGDVVCEITLAIPGEPGMTVTGLPYPSKIKGTNAVISAGRNTEFNEEGTLLLSQKTGHVTFSSGKFHVDPILVINGNIDNSTGNLDYDGDILITGDVRNGFSVKATGTIEIRGSVEAAQITANGPITIASGMTGDGKGTLTSDSDIRCRYLEHCTILAGGSVYAESIINSNVKSGQDIVVTSGIGVIIGGSLVATNNITARIIGSKVRRLITELILVNVPKHVEETNRLHRELEQLHVNMSEVKKNISFLDRVQKPGKEQLLNNLKQAADYLIVREQAIKHRLEEINTEEMAQTGLIKCQQLLPIIRIRIGSSNILVQEEYSSSTIYKNREGEITIGSN